METSTCNVYNQAVYAVIMWLHKWTFIANEREVISGAWVISVVYPKHTPCEGLWEPSLGGHPKMDAQKLGGIVFSKEKCVAINTFQYSEI